VSGDGGGGFLVFGRCGFKGGAESLEDLVAVFYFG